MHDQHVTEARPEARPGRVPNPRAGSTPEHLCWRALRKAKGKGPLIAGIFRELEDYEHPPKYPPHLSGRGAKMSVLRKILAEAMPGEGSMGQRPSRDLLTDWYGSCAHVPITEPLAAWMLRKVMDREEREA